MIFPSLTFDIPILTFQFLYADFVFTDRVRIKAIFFVLNLLSTYLMKDTLRFKGAEGRE